MNDSRPEVTAVVLAAGASARFGHAKQLLTIDGETLVARAVRIAREAGCGRVIVVARPGSRWKVDAEVIENEEADAGIASSIRAGVRRTGGARVLILLCDQPSVTAQHLRALLADGAPVVATGYAGIAGVPAVFAASLHAELCSLRGDRGARCVIEAHQDERVVVAFEDAAFDLDTPEDFERWSKTHRQG